MTGEYYITKDLLKQHSPCEDGYRWFCENYPNGGKYQEILDKLCDDNRFGDACWLLSKIGATTDILELDTLEDHNKQICFAGSIKVRDTIRVLNIKAGGHIEAGEYIGASGYIEAGGYIKAGEDIEAGEGINASWGIKAGGDIEAGWDIKAGENINAGAFIKAGEDINAGLDIEAGWGIKAGEDIKGGGDIKAGEDIVAVWGIKAGWSIEAGGYIKAGNDYGIYAGLNVRLSEQEQYGYITAKAKPENIMCGNWKESEST